MARSFHRRERLSAMSDINMTPLIDLAFALLIIFMITTPLLEQTIPLQLPLEAQTPQPPPLERNIQVISINGEGTIFWGDEAVSPQRLDELLGSLTARRDPPVLHIRADASLQYQRVIDVIELIKRNQLTKISLDTQVR